MKKCHVQKQNCKEMCACSVGKFDSLRLDCQNHIYYIIIQLITRVSSNYKLTCYILEKTDQFIL